MQLYMIELAVTNWPLSVAWYCDQLRLRVTLRDDANQFALLESEGGRLALKVGTPQVGGVKLHFQVNDLSREMERLGLACETKTSPEGYRRVLLHDPDGYAIVLFEWLNRV